MFGPNGKPVIKLAWEQYKEWQRWDEWPERMDNPPLTVETVFWYENEQYMVTASNNEYVIVSLPDFNEKIHSKNLISLLELPLFDSNSFKELICEFFFEN